MAAQVAPSTGILPEAGRDHDSADRRDDVGGHRHGDGAGIRSDSPAVKPEPKY